MFRQLHLHYCKYRSFHLYRDRGYPSGTHSYYLQRSNSETEKVYCRPVSPEYAGQEGRDCNLGKQNKPEVQAIIRGAEGVLDSNTVSNLVQNIKGLGKGMNNLELKVDKMDIRISKVEGKTDGIDICLQFVESKVRELESERATKIKNINIFLSVSINRS